MFPRQEISSSRCIALIVALGVLVIVATLVWFFWGFDGLGSASDRFATVTSTKPFKSSSGGRGNSRGRTPKNLPPDEPRDPARPDTARVTLAGVVAWQPPVHANAPGRMPARMGERLMGDDELPLGKALAEDARASAWLLRWEAAILAGQEPAGDLTDELNTILASGTLSVAALYDLGREVAFVMGRQASQPIYRALVERARKDSAGGMDKLSDVDREVLRTALRGASRPLWLQNDYSISGPLMAMLAELEPKGTYEAWRARFIYAESLYMRAREGPDQPRQAADIYERLIAEAPALKLPEILIGETHLCAGYSHFGANQWKQAVPHFEQAAKPGWHFAPAAARYGIDSAIKANDAAEANRLLENLAGPAGMNAQETITYKSRIMDLHP